MATKLADPQTDRTGVTGAMDVTGRTFQVTKGASFEAAHFMGQKPDGHPYKHVHGHSFRVEATVAGIVKPGKEWVEDFADVKRAIEEVAGELDHRLLNEIDGLEVPTLERICIWVAERLSKRVSGLIAVEISRPSLDERCLLQLG